VYRLKDAAEVVYHDRPDLALVDPTTWDKVQAHLEQRRGDVLQDPVTGQLRGRAKGCLPAGAGGNPWHGLLYCKVCGGPFVVSTTKRGVDGLAIRYLVCNRKHNFKDHCANVGVVRLDLLNCVRRDVVAFVTL
jgi:hypothetical protein